MAIHGVPTIDPVSTRHLVLNSFGFWTRRVTTSGAPPDFCHILRRVDQASDLSGQLGIMAELVQSRPVHMD